MLDQTWPIYIMTYGTLETTLFRHDVVIHNTHVTVSHSVHHSLTITTPSLRYTIRCCTCIWWHIALSDTINIRHPHTIPSPIITLTSSTVYLMRGSCWNAGVAYTLSNTPSSHIPLVTSPAQYDSTVHMWMLPSTHQPSWPHPSRTSWVHLYTNTIHGMVHDTEMLPRSTLIYHCR